MYVIDRGSSRFMIVLLFVTLKIIIFKLLKRVIFFLCIKSLILCLMSIYKFEYYDKII